MKHKDHYDDAYVELLAAKLAGVQPGFDGQGFTKSLQGRLNDKELFARFDLIVDQMQTWLDGAYTANLDAFYGLLGPELAGPEGMFTQGWWLWPLGRYVERLGPEDWRASLAFLKELTKRFTGEYAIRPLLRTYPTEVMEELLEWTQDESVHVRRLASEGVRVYLPWGGKLLVAVEQFETYARLLTNLKDDPERFVQKSVGNNLNDLYRAAPEKAEQLIAGWEKTPTTPAREWIVRHGMRGKRKREAKA